MSVLGIIGLIVLGREFVTLWVGEEYALLFPCILLLSLPYFISASQQIANSSITALNKVKYSVLEQAERELRSMLQESRAVEYPFLS